MSLFYYFKVVIIGFPQQFDTIQGRSELTPTFKYEQVCYEGVHSYQLVGTASLDV